MLVLVQLALSAAPAVLNEAVLAGWGVCTEIGVSPERFILVLLDSAVAVVNGATLAGLGVHAEACVSPEQVVLALLWQP